MKVQWKRILVKITVWLITDLLLNFLGLDDLADYGEFIFERFMVMNCQRLSYGLAFQAD